MFLTWNETINILKNIFEMPSNRLSAYFSLSPSAFSRLENGNTTKSYIDIDNLYKKIFDLENPKSLVCTKQWSADIVMSLLKNSGYTKNDSFQEVMCDVWEEKDYKTFVMKMFTQTRMSSPSTKNYSDYEPQPKLHHKPSLSDNNDSISQQRIVGARISVPKEYKQCAYCSKWDGNTNYAYKIKTGVYGTCMMTNSKQLSTSGVRCIDYEPDYTKIASHMYLPRSMR
jgi:hypothetical protein